MKEKRLFGNFILLSKLLVTTLPHTHTMLKHHGYLYHLHHRVFVHLSKLQIIHNLLEQPAIYVYYTKKSVF